MRPLDSTITPEETRRGLALAAAEVRASAPRVGILALCVNCGRTGTTVRGRCGCGSECWVPVGISVQPGRAS